MSKKYYHYQSKTMRPCSMGDKEYLAATQSWLCLECCSPKYGTHSIDVRIKDIAPEGPLNFINGCGLPVAKRSFLYRFGQERVSRDLYTGRVFGPSGQEVPDWITFRGKHELIVRGSERAQFRKCNGCGRILYFAMGQRYLFPEPPDDIVLYESNLFGLIVPEWLAVQCDMTKPAGVRSDRLMLAEGPRDGIEEPLY